MKTRFLIIVGVAIALTITFFVLGPSQGHIAEYFLTDEQFEDLILGDTPHVTDSLKIPNAERDAKLAAGYKLYPGGWVHPDDLGNQQPIYRDNPNNPGELVLDLDAMIKEYESISEPESDINESSTVSENKKPILTHEQIDEQIDIVFGNARKSWTVYPGGAGFIPPENSTLIRIYKEVTIDIPPLNFTAMLDDKIFVDRCESNGGTWNYSYHDCEGIWEICQDVGGIVIQRNITPPCTGICLDKALYRMSCVFEYEN